jgi:hypothetical protein
MRNALAWINDELSDDADARLDLLEEAYEHLAATDSEDLNARVAAQAAYMVLAGWKNPERFEHEGNARVEPQRTARLYSITAIIEANDDADAGAVADAIAKAICPYPVADSDHACPRGWITMRHELDEEEAATWRDPDALNR